MFICVYLCMWIYNYNTEVVLCVSRVRIVQNYFFFPSLPAKKVIEKKNRRHQIDQLSTDAILVIEF